MKQHAHTCSFGLITFCSGSNGSWRVAEDKRKNGVVVTWGGREIGITKSPKKKDNKSH
jgi:hypothetical protein